MVFTTISRTTLGYSKSHKTEKDDQLHVESETDVDLKSSTKKAKKMKRSQTTRGKK